MIVSSCRMWIVTDSQYTIQVLELMEVFTLVHDEPFQAQRPRESRLLLESPPDRTLTNFLFNLSRIWFFYSDDLTWVACKFNICLDKHL